MAGGEADARSDADLVAAMNRGEGDAFAVLYERHRGWVYRIALRFCGRPEDAVEVTQEVFIALLRQFPGFRLTAKLTTYLYPVAKNMGLARRRRETMRRQREPEAARGESGPGETPREAQDSACLRAALERLAEPHREVLLMRAVDGMTMEEIARALAIPVGTVKSRLHNALRQLRGDEGLGSYFE